LALHGFKSEPAAAVAIASIELAHRMRKRPLRLGRARGRRRQLLKSAWDRALFVT
jgi:hypothetical protein